MTPNSYADTQDEEESRDSVGDMETPTPSSRRSSSIGIRSNISSVESGRSRVSDGLTTTGSVSEAYSTQLSNAMTPNSYADNQEEEESRDSVGDMKTPTPSSRRSSSIGISSNVSSVESVRSLISSTRSSLSPLVEEDVQDDEDSSQSRSQTVGSIGSPLSRGQTMQKDEESLQSRGQTTQGDGENDDENDDESLLSQSQLIQDYEESSPSCSQTAGSAESLLSRSQTVHDDEESSQSRSQTIQDDEGSSLSQGQTERANKRHASDITIDSGASSVSPSTYHRSQTTFDGEMSSNVGDTESNHSLPERKKTRLS